MTANPDRRVSRLISAIALLSAASATAVAADRGTVEPQDNFANAATSPLEDLNLKRIEIPDVLKRAVKDPYDMDGLKTCEAIAGEVGRLDGALGPDLDEPPPPPKTKGAVIHSAAVAAVREKAHSLLPFRGWIRTLTGAERHDQAVRAAIRAGGVRRGYLKGVGMHMNCAPPAAPSWYKPHGQAAGFFAQLWTRIVAWFWSWWPF
jgi:hypothetical protein